MSLAVSPARLDFGSIVVGSSSSPASFTISNTGQQTTGPIATSISGPFSIVSDGCATTSLAGGASCTITGRYSPTSSGPASGQLALTASPGGTTTAPLLGTSPTGGVFGTISVANGQPVSGATISARSTGASTSTDASGQSGQFVSLAFGQQARAAGIAQSMGSKGDCFDNAVAESFFATLKKELINRRSWPTKAELRTEVFDYIEVFYNRERRHSTLGQRSPADYEKLPLPATTEEQVHRLADC